MTARGDRHRDAGDPSETPAHGFPVVRVEDRKDPAEERVPNQIGEALQAELGRRGEPVEDDTQELSVALDEAKVGQGDVEPTLEPVSAVFPARAEAEEGANPPPPVGLGVVAALHSLEVGSHPFAAPALVPRRLGDFVPIFRGAANRDHGVVDRATADSLRPGIEDPFLVPSRTLLGKMNLRVAAPLRVFVEVLDEEAEGVTRVLRRGGVKQGDVRRLDLESLGAVGLPRSHFEDQHGVASLRQPSRQGPSGGSRSDDNEVDRSPVAVPPLIGDRAHGLLVPKFRHFINRPAG